MGLKPSLGRVPIDPPYMGRAAGPMARSVQDAALLMQALAHPDARDCMSLPPQAIDWSLAWRQDKPLKGLRIGLLLEAGCGLPVEPAIRVAIEHAAHLFEAQGAVVTPLAPFMTPDLLAGLDHFWRMRSLLDLDALSAPARASVLPVIRDWADSARTMSGADVFRAYSATHTTRVATCQAMQGLDYVISPVSPNAPAPADWPSPTNDPCAGWNTSASPCPSTWANSPPFRSTAATWIHPPRPAPCCPSACRSPASASTTWACCRWRAPSSNCAGRSATGRRRRVHPPRPAENLRGHCLRLAKPQRPAQGFTPRNWHQIAPALD